LSKDSLVKGTLILTIAALVARFLGVFQRIPLIHLIGDQGMGSFGIAFNLYSVLLVVATAGIPSALSKMISERLAVGRDEEASRIYRTAIWFAVIAGVVSSVVLYALSDWYAGTYSEDPKAILATRAIAPALLLFPLIAVMRGYFQGRQRMMPNGVSQVVEQIFRLIVAVSLAFLFLPISDEWAIAGASFGGVAGGVAALGVMIYYLLKLRKEDRREKGKGNRAPVADDTVKLPVLNGTGMILKHLMRLSVPIVIFSITVTLIYLIDSSSVVPFLKGQFGYEGASELNGILTGRAQALAGLPIILAIALSQSVVPLISSTYSQGNMTEVSRHTAKVLRLALLSGLPMVLIIAIGARPIDGFVLGYEATEYAYNNGPWVISLLTVSAMFQIIMQTSGAVLMGLGRMRPLMIGVGIGIAAKVALNYLLVPWVGIYGFVIATGFCFIVMSIVNILALRQDIAFVTLRARQWAGLAVSVAVIAAVGFTLEQLTHRYVHLFAIDRLNEGVNAVIVCGAVAILYPVMLLLTKVVTREDAGSLPGPLKRLVARLSKQGERSRAQD